MTGASTSTDSFLVSFQHAQSMEELPYSVDHANLWPLHLYLQAFGLWRPSKCKWWLVWQFLVSVAVHSYLLLFISVAPWGDHDNPINAFFRTHTRLPVRFSGMWTVFIPSVCLNALPVTCFLFSTAYLNSRSSWWLNLIRCGGRVRSTDAEVHLHKIVASIPRWQSSLVPASGRIAAPMRAFEQRVSRRTAIMAAWHGLWTLACAAVECEEVGWGVVYFFWVLLWSSPVPAAALILSVVCEAHLLECDAIVECIRQQSNLSRVWLICRSADARLRETSDKFRVYFVPPAVFILSSMVCLGVEAITDNELCAIVLSNQLWVFFFLAFFILVYTSSVLATVSVTESASKNIIRAVNDYQLPYSQGNRTGPGASFEHVIYNGTVRTEVEHLKAYLQTLSSGFYICGTRVDSSLLSRAALLCVTCISAFAQRMLGRM